MQTPILGSFEPWSKTIGGILHFAGIPGFLTNLDSLYAQADDGAVEWNAFLRAWHSRYGNKPVAVGTIAADLQSDASNALRDTLPDPLGGFVVFEPAQAMEAAKFMIKDVGKFKIRLGKQLQQRVGRRYGNNGLHLIRHEDSHSKTATWSVEFAGSGGGRRKWFDRRRMKNPCSWRGLGSRRSRNSPHSPRLAKWQALTHVRADAARRLGQREDLGDSAFCSRDFVTT
jgi:hypothetical protein